MAWRRSGDKAPRLHSFDIRWRRMVSFTLGSMSTLKNNMNVYVVGRRIVHVRLVADSLKRDECYCTHSLARRCKFHYGTLYGALLKLIVEHKVNLGWRTMKWGMSWTYARPGQSSSASVISMRSWIGARRKDTHCQKRGKTVKLNSSNFYTL